jgi:hypothetical protein
MKTEETNCGYLNSDGSCNSTGICEETGCKAIETNFENVVIKAARLIAEGNRLLKEIKRLGYEG